MLSARRDRASSPPRSAAARRKTSRTSPFRGASEGVRAGICLSETLAVAAPHRDELRRRPVQRLSGDPAHLLQNLPERPGDEEHAEVGGGTLGKRHGIVFPQILHAETRGRAEGARGVSVEQVGIALHLRHHVGGEKQGVHAVEIASHVSGTADAEEEGRHLSGGPQVAHPGRLSPFGDAPLEGLAQKGRTVVEAPFLGETHQVGNRAPHAHGVHLFVGNGQEEKVRLQALRRGGHLRQVGRVDGEPALHVHDAPPEEEISRFQVPPGLGRNVPFTDAPRIDLGLEGKVPQLAAHIHVHHVVVSRENDGLRRPGRRLHEGKERVPPQSARLHRDEEEVFRMGPEIGQCRQPIPQKADQLVLSFRAGNAPDPHKVLQQSVNSTGRVFNEVGHVRFQLLRRAFCRAMPFSGELRSERFQE